MNEDNELLKKRFAELAAKAERGGYYTFTDFLGLSEQSAFAEVCHTVRVPYTPFGGCEGTERVMLRFGDEDEIGYSVPFPITCLKVAPVSQKYAEELTHRDFLGTILGLGLERDVIGDIAIIDNIGYVFVKEDIADFILSSLTRVRHTDVKPSVADSIPEGELYRTETVRIQLSGERLDAVISKVYRLSREESLRLFRKRLVFVNGKLCENNSYVPKEGDRISVRGYGRLIYRGCESLSRKGKLNVLVDVYV